MEFEGFIFIEISQTNNMWFCLHETQIIDELNETIKKWYDQSEALRQGERQGNRGRPNVRIRRELGGAAGAANMTFNDTS